MKVTNARQIHDAELLILDRLRDPLRHLADSQRYRCDQARVLFFALHRAGLMDVARRAVERFYGDDAKLRVLRSDDGKVVYRNA
jgi:hypothetical protein